MRTRPSGFTMIELIVVIVVLGILAATALPKFVDLGDDARKAALSGSAGAAGSAMTINFSGCAVVGNDATTYPDKCKKVDACSDVSTLLQGGLPSSVSSVAAKTTDLGTTNGASQLCVMTDTKGNTAEFTGIAAGN